MRNDAHRGEWLQRLARRWKISPGRALVVLLVFACTGTTVVLIKRPLLDRVAGDGQVPVIFSVLYYFLILPVYNLLLLIYGLLLGQFGFFWAFEKRLLKRVFGWLRSR
ncbi:MAG: prolipoprotein diacylglyceryl transferase [Flavobacteriales bacterium]|nr:diacylglyceryl transferase [Flavobacteriales bacterium]MCB9167971.1 prolipoprotein diacylglyceryl transferase [Flavobacteriales bacterium]